MHNPIFLFLIMVITITGVTAVTTGTSITKHILSPGDVIGETSYIDTLMTNGGNLAVNKNVDFDSRNQTVSSYNLQSEKVLTYTSMEGAHLLGEESYLLDNAGSYKSDDDGSIRCVYSSDNLKWLPAFCNIIQAKSSLINVNNARISEKGSLRMVGNEDTPAGLNYQIAVTPDNRVASSAIGTIKTEFAGSVMEARDNSTKISATNQWKDATEVTGGMKNFQKFFTYQSGLRI